MSSTSSLVAGLSLEGSTFTGPAGEEEAPPPLATIAAAAVASLVSVSISSYFPGTAEKLPPWASCASPERRRVEDTGSKSGSDRGHRVVASGRGADEGSGTKWQRSVKGWCTGVFGLVGILDTHELWAFAGNTRVVGTPGVDEHQISNKKRTILTPQQHKKGPEAARDNANTNTNTNTNTNNDTHLPLVSGLVPELLGEFFRSGTLVAVGAQLLSGTGLTHPPPPGPHEVVVAAGVAAHLNCTTRDARTSTGLFWNDVFTGWSDTAGTIVTRKVLLEDTVQRWHDAQRQLVFLVLPEPSPSGEKGSEYVAHAGYSRARLNL